MVKQNRGGVDIVAVGDWDVQLDAILGPGVDVAVAISRNCFLRMVDCPLYASGSTVFEALSLHGVEHSPFSPYL